VLFEIHVSVIQLVIRFTNEEYNIFAVKTVTVVYRSENMSDYNKEWDKGRYAGNKRVRIETQTFGILLLGLFNHSSSTGNVTYERYSSRKYL
jgi:hypothetical protein